MYKNKMCVQRVREREREREKERNRKKIKHKRKGTAAISYTMIRDVLAATNTYTCTSLRDNWDMTNS